uniref:RRM domain-containing protein n=1 Tax=Triticum urartu TaxID=4572 RepID=A0A8R7PE13_TRIUA
MTEKEGGRIFVGGLSWDTTERTLERAFGEFGKVIETQVLAIFLHSFACIVRARRRICVEIILAALSRLVLYIG